MRISSAFSFPIVPPLRNHHQFQPLDSVNWHQCLSQIRIKSIIDCAPRPAGIWFACNSTTAPQLEPAFVLGLKILPNVQPSLGRDTKRILINHWPIPATAINFMWPHLHKRATDFNLARNHMAKANPCDRARRYAHGGFSCRRPPPATIITGTIFFPIGIIRMTWAKTIAISL